ncbi:MAG TPA: VCBS repeat-containing protein, partial [Planctomycetota bacterium]|nr:VCBS repeat-containing protein [Planctomycetota bacterium]
VEAFTANQVVTLLGNGTGGLGSPVVTAVANVSSLALGDVNGDAKLDLVTGHMSHAEVRLGNGAGGFGSPVASPPTSNFAGKVAVGDLNHDAKLDFVCATTFGKIDVFLGDGTGQFALHASAPSVSNPNTVHLALVDGDGNLDVVVDSAFAQAQSVAVGRGDGLGGFAPLAFFGGGAETSRSTLADFDGDGALDVALADLAGTILRGDGAGGFHAASVVDGIPHPGPLALADFDGNGTLDVAVAYQTSIFSGVPALALRLGDGAGGLAAGSGAALPVQTAGLAAGDLDGDGTTDLVSANQGSVFVPIPFAVTTVTVSGGVLGSPVQQGSTGSTPGLAPSAVVLADLQGDGRLDAIVTDGSASRFVVMAGAGGGVLAAPVAVATASAPRGLVACDLDSDGRIDVATACGLADQVGVHLGDGAGGFAPLVAFPAGDNPVAIAAGDVDRDGLLDLAVANQTPGTVSLLRGTGSSFAAPVAFPATASPRAISIADLDGDGLLDVAVAGPVEAELAVLRGLGNGSFLPSDGYALGSGVATFALGDLDGDGHVDAVGSDTNYSSLHVLRNVGEAPAGVVAYGTGTAGCLGVHGIGVSGPPAIGNVAFGVTTTNAPPLSLGLLLIADAPDFLGSDTFGIDLDLHVNLLGSGLVLAFDAYGDATGTAFAPVPLPGNPALIGITLYQQTIWAWLGAGACHVSTFALSSSRGLAVTFGP